MGDTELYNASRAVFKMFGDFFNDVIQEIGKEKAITLYGLRGDRGGASLVERLKKQAEEKDVNVAEIAKDYGNFYTSLGFDLKLEAGPEKMAFKVSRCPRYDGFIEAGIDHETIKALCQANIDANDARLKMYNPKASVTIQVRSPSGGMCVESFHIPK